MGILFEPTAQHIIDFLVAEAGPLDLTKHFYDLGSGDGRFVKAFAAAGAQATGIESHVELAVLSVSLTASTPNTSIINGDIFDQDVSDGTHFWIAINYRSPTDRLDDLKTLLAPASGAFVVVNDATWGWPIVKTITVPEGTYTQGMKLYVRGDNDWNFLRTLTVDQILRLYSPQVRAEIVGVGPRSFKVYRVP